MSPAGRVVFVLALPGVCSAAAQPRAAGDPLAKALAAVTPQVVRAHTAFLADALLAGRTLGTAGGELAARYVASQFAAMGLEPASDSGFLQEIRLVGVTPHPTLVVGTGRQTIALAHPGEFVAWSARAAPAVTSDGELVFAGFGAAQRGAVNGFEAAPIRGRIVLMLVDDAGEGGASSAGEVAVAVAARLGAAGVLLVPAGRSATDWSAIQESWSGERLSTDSAATGPLRFGAWVSQAAARRFLGHAGIDFDVLIHRARLDDFRPIPLAVNVAVHIRNTVRHLHAANVAARLSGDDPARSDETVLLSTRYDGSYGGATAQALPVGNGAEEPAARAAVLLAVAAALARAEPKLPRSVMFLATAGGRDGVLGAQAFVARPLVPLHQVVAVIDIGRAAVGDTTALAALGADQSSLDAAWRRAAVGEGLTPTAAGHDRQYPPDAGRYLVFSQAGVPAVSLVTLVPSGGEQDDLRFDGAAKQGRVIVRLTTGLATTAEFPAWMDESEFAPFGLRLRRLRGGT